MAWDGIKTQPNTQRPVCCTVCGEGSFAWRGKYRVATGPLLKSQDDSYRHSKCKPR